MVGDHLSAHGWVRSANATSVLCRPPLSSYLSSLNLSLKILSPNSSVDLYPVCPGLSRKLKSTTLIVSLADEHW